ncbi:MAG: phosphomannomutase/phosphoglucomutase [Acidobacteria bacterium]|nr:phosphomannomutase/phosphoglucomutase [Acidobacteriota bacterium]
MDPNIFREYDIRGIVGASLTDDTVARLACAIGTFLRSNGSTRIAIGYDARESSPRFCDLLTEGLNASGCDVVLIGRVPTPVLYHTVFTCDVDGGVMITGSHNPPDHNGFKICLGKHTLFGSQIQEIREIAMSEPPASAGGENLGSVERREVLGNYIADITSRTSLGPRRLRAVIDAGNGMGGVTAVPVYKKLGIELTELFTEPDSTFPNHHADPTVEENLQDLIAKVKETKADVGIAFDGDADRIGIVDETGRIVWGDELMVLFSREILNRRPGSTIIAEVKCSQRLFDDIEKHGGQAIMWKAGHSIIKAKMKVTGAALAGEMSGHIFFEDRFYGFDDACYAGARLLEILSSSDESLSQLLAELPEAFSPPDIRIDCPGATKSNVAAKIARHFESLGHEVNTIDGARITFENGWGLVRPSNTQALLVLRFEADTVEHLAEIKEVIEPKVAEFIASA